MSQPIRTSRVALLTLAILTHAGIASAQFGGDVACNGIPSRELAEPGWTIEPPGTGPEIVIPDEPRTIDPVTLVPEKLRTKVSIELDGVHLRVFAAWLEDQLNLPVVIDEAALVDAGIDPDMAPLTGGVKDLPVYLLLNRVLSDVQGVPLTSYVDDGRLRVTTIEDADTRMVRRIYNASDLVKARYSPELIEYVLINATDGPWFNVDGVGGTINSMGHIITVRQTRSQQLHVAAMLEALKNHGRETAVLEPIQNVVIREKLRQPVTVDFTDVPLSDAIASLSEMTGIEFRIEHTALADAGVAEDTAVSLSVTDKALETVLRMLLEDVGGVSLIAFPQDGSLLVSTAEDADTHFRTVVYDVRDLSRNMLEADALIELIQDQTEGPWFDIDGLGGTILAPAPGTLVIRQSEQLLAEVRHLLASFREVIQTAGRPTIPLNDDEVVTRYYRVPLELAQPLAAVLPKLIGPEMWKSDNDPEGGAVYVLPVGSEIVNSAGHPVSSTSSGDKNPHATHKLPKAVLIVRQTRAVQVEVGQVLAHIEQGDSSWLSKDEARRAPLTPQTIPGATGIGMFSTPAEINRSGSLSGH